MLSSQEKIELILSWADNNPESDFDTSFTEKMQERLDDFGYLTEKQDAALDNIIDRFNMEEEDNEEYSIGEYQDMY